ncbi:hypothetical protein ACJJIW_12350 [Microbulbifer sp. JMSA004]|uniref:hypothetical protein n=1 Tax=unclassified Microbulbifer TaxID=2619833 RepID=UPI0024ACAAE0|nr:hypothetical protein [Microbulbifer sp. VAAF005]WHI46093.1 hypothetical protein P0078_20605 [Microbulbifer sp. VAAF005]
MATNTYIYKSYADGESDSDTLWGQVQNSLNSLSQNGRDSVKIASSNEHGGNCRSVIIYTDDAAPAGSVDTLSQTWNYETFNDSDGYSTMYQNAVNFLNETLNSVQAYYSRLSMIDAKSHSAHLVVWYREGA